MEVFGEVSGFKFSGPHAYFTLKDKDSQLSCVCFYAAKTYNPKDGESVIVKGSLDYYLKGGRLSLQASSIQPVGKGMLFWNLKGSKQSCLRRACLTRRTKTYSQICETGACGYVQNGRGYTRYRDDRKAENPVIDIVVKDVRVQGEGAGKEIAKVLERVDKLGYDIIVIARGGGSLEDLAPFYDEQLVRAVYAMKTPVVSAVGHETDFSLCDFVADARAATPTAAGELIAYDYYAMRDQLTTDMQRLKQSATRGYERCVSKARLSSAQLQRLASGFYTAHQHKVENCIQRIRTLAERKMEGAIARTEKATASLDNLSPLKVLGRGYFRLQSGQKTISKVATLKVGEYIKATGGDGSVTAQITQIDLNKEN